MQPHYISINGYMKDITGQEFHRLTAIRPLKHRGRVQWECLCECGNVVNVATDKLLSGHTKSCTCLQKETIGDARRKHGYSNAKHPLYRTWLNMRSRCNTPTNPRYGDYGGRGIYICKEWDDFTQFISDMGDRPEGYSLDRKDNDGPYSPENCRWATSKQQRANSRR